MNPEDFPTVYSGVLPPGAKPRGQTNGFSSYPQYVKARHRAFTAGDRVRWFDTHDGGWVTGRIADIHQGRVQLVTWFDHVSWCSLEWAELKVSYL